LGKVKIMVPVDYLEEAKKVIEPEGEAQ